MADIGSELVSHGATKPSPLESAGKFVKEKIIDPHTPEAHYRDIMKKYFLITDKLEGTSLELTRRLRPTVEIAARAAGWSQTFTELYFAGQAVAFLGFLGFRGLKSAVGVFGDMAKKHGGEAAGAAATVVAVSAPAVVLDEQVNVDASATLERKTRIQPTKQVEEKRKPKVQDALGNDRVSTKKQSVGNARAPYRRPSPGDVLNMGDRYRTPKKLKRRKEPKVDVILQSVQRDDPWMSAFGEAYDAAFRGAEPPADHEHNKRQLIDVIRELATSENAQIVNLLASQKHANGNAENALRRAFAMAHLAVSGNNGARLSTDEAGVRARIQEQEELWLRYQGLLKQLQEDSKRKMVATNAPKGKI